MFRIENGREHFYQWDLEQRLIIDDNTITEVHFCNKTDDCALVVEVYTEGALRFANVPNILLQTDWSIRAYAYCNDCYTKQCATFKVMARSKPADYVYTETEVKKWENLAERAEKALEQLEDFNIKNGAYDGSIVSKQGGAYNSEGKFFAPSEAHSINVVAFGSANKGYGANNFLAGQGNNTYQYNAASLGAANIVGDAKKYNYYLYILNSIGYGTEAETAAWLSNEENWQTFKKNWNNNHIDSPEQIISEDTFTDFQHKYKYSFGFATGTSNKITGRAAAGFGTYLLASSENQAAFGSFNKDNPQAILMVGYGTGKEDAERKNAFEVRKDGSAYIAYQGTDNNSAVIYSTLKNYLKADNSTSNYSHRLYGINSKGEQTVYRATNGVANNTIAMRDARGGCQFANPQNAHDAATKNYVDNAIKNIPTGGVSAETLAKLFRVVKVSPEEVWALDQSDEVSMWFCQFIIDADTPITEFPTTTQIEGDIVFFDSTIDIDGTIYWIQVPFMPLNQAYNSVICNDNNEIVARYELSFNPTLVNTDAGDYYGVGMYITFYADFAKIAAPTIKRTNLTYKYGTVNADTIKALGGN